MIKAIVFDYYGVLLANTHDQYLERLRQESPERVDEFSAVNRAADMGILSQEASRRRMAELLGVTYEELLAEYANGERPNEPLIAFIEAEIKPQYSVGLLSNSTSKGQLEVRFAPGRLDTIFDEIVSTGDIGFAKPQAEAYEFIAMRLGVLPEECVMIDDIAEYCDGARQAGMQAIQYRSMTQLRRDLEALLLDPTSETV